MENLQPVRYVVSTVDGKRFVEFEIADNGDVEEANQFIVFRLEVPLGPENPRLQQPLQDALKKAGDAIAFEFRKVERGEHYVPHFRPSKV